MNKNDKSAMIQLLNIQISNLGLKYAHLINQTGKLSLLKDVRLEIKGLKKKLENLKKSDITAVKISLTSDS